MDKLIGFLNGLEEREIYYRLNKIRDSILVEIAVPGERWEVEFLADGEVLLERFHSSGKLEEEKELEQLLNEFRD